MDRFIREHGLTGWVKYAVSGCNTIENLQTYLKTNPHKKYNLVSVWFNSGNFNLIWELMSEHKQPFVKDEFLLNTIK